MAATISTNPLNLTYKQFDAAPTNVLITFSDLNNNDISFGNVPDWLAISSISVVDATTATALFTVDTDAANLLSEGDYSIVVEIFTPRDEPDIVHGNFYEEGSLTVNLNFTETVILEVSPLNISFNYTTGGTLPTGKIVSIISENSWTVVKSTAWIGISIASGSDNGSVTVTADPSGLAVGTHTGTVTIDDGTDDIVIDVVILVSDGNDETDYLFVAPTEIEFVKNVGSALDPTKKITLNASEAWTAASSETWLDLSKTSGGSGSDEIELTIDDTGLLSGFYTAEVSITAGSMFRKTYVTFYFNESIISVPDSGALYFSEDDVQIQLSSDNANAILEADFKSVTDNAAFLYPKKAPYIKGLATLNVGEECANFIKSLDLPNLITSKVTTLIKPSTLSFTAYEKNYFTAELLDSIARNNLYFLNGKTPSINNKLNNVPSVITVSRKAILALHVYKTIAPGTIEISGAITKSIAVDDAANSNVYSALINLNEFNLKELDVITINFDFLEITVRIKEETTSSVSLVYENEWQLPEILELTGGLSIKNNAGFSTQKIQSNNEVIEQIYKATPTESFSIDTDWIESEEEIEWFNKMLNSKRFFLLINSEKIEVIPTFKSLPIFEEREHQKNFRLTFKKAIV